MGYEYTHQEITHKEGSKNKHRFSLSFGMLCLLTILSLTDIINMTPRLISIFHNPTLSECGHSIFEIFSSLTPPAIVILLWCNRRRDVTAFARPFLTICGCIWFGKFVSNLPTYIIRNNSPYDVIFPVAKTIWLISTPLITAILLLRAASGVKKHRTGRLLILFASLGIFINFTYFILLIMYRNYSWIAKYHSPVFPDVITPFLMYIGLWALPKTLYNYRRCWFFDKNTAKMLGITAAVIILVLILMSQ